MIKRSAASLIYVLVFLAGCQPTSKEPANEASKLPADCLAALGLAVQQQDWDRARAASKEVLLLHASDPDAVELTARAAHGSGDLTGASDLMLEACKLESFANDARTSKAMASLLAAGRLYECIELLEHALAVHPNQHDFRRRLYQMCWGAEDWPRSTLHGRHLILQRQFDLDLLLELTATERRSESPDALVELAKRSQNDNRPLVAAARVQFDNGQYDLAESTLRQSLRYHPKHAPSLSLLCQTLIENRKHNEYVTLMRDVPDNIKDYPRYWMALGDRCRTQNQFPQAARAYWEATRRDSDFRLAWLRLNQLSTQHGLDWMGMTSSQSKAVEQRLLLLTRFSQQREEFVKSGKQSPAQMLGLARTLESLGRLWEAEAWTAIARTMSSGKDQQVVDSLRSTIVSKLTKNTPWQSSQSHPELALNLEHLPLPLADSKWTEPNKSPPAQATNKKPHQIAIMNEATERDLRFFGFTGEGLNQPGVKHYQTLGCGGGTIDFDLDGWPDIYLAAAGGTPPNLDSHSNTLWRNINGRFTDVTSPSGTSDYAFGQGIAVGDLNEDGFPDLLSLSYGPNALYLNNGDGTFTAAGDRFLSGLLKNDWSSSGAIADINLDGLSDIVILAYGTGFDPVTRECKHPTSHLVRACSPLIFAGASDHFLFNTPSGHFEDVTDQLGQPSIIGRGLGVLVGRFSREAELGVLIANDLTSNHFWSIQSNPLQKANETALLRGLGSDDRSPAQGSMGIASGDFDRDGDLDLYVTNFANEANTYHEQQGPGFWSDQTVAKKLLEPTMPFVGFGTQAIDLDNDGALELVVSNGHVDSYPSETSSTPYAQPMLIFQHQSTQDYLSIGDTIQSNYLGKPHVGRALWTIDANRDARLDLLVTHQTEPVALLINQTKSPGNWLELVLSGRSCSRDAIGATITIHSEGSTWSGALMAGDGYLCSNQRIVHVGRGESTANCDVEIQWPDGNVQWFKDLAINQTWLLIQSDQSAFQLCEPISELTTPVGL